MGDSYSKEAATATVVDRRVRSYWSFGSFACHDSSSGYGNDDEIVAELCEVDIQFRVARLSHSSDEMTVRRENSMR